MFIEELQPIVKEAIYQPIAFAGGLVSGLLKLKLSDDPLKSWLDKQGGNVSEPDRPQTISID